MSRYKVTCPHCSAALVASAGSNIKCPECGCSLIVTPPPDEGAQRQRWLREVAEALTPFGVTVRESGMGSGNVDGDGDMVKLRSADGRVCVLVWRYEDDVQARAWEKLCRQGGNGIQSSQRDIWKGRVAVRTVDRVVYFVEEKRKYGARGHARALLDKIIQAVSPIHQPTAPAAYIRESSPSPTPGDTSTSDEIERLTQLHAQGTLTEDEFAAAKGQLLGMPIGGDA